MDLRKAVDGALNSNMDRKEFLKYVGVSALTLIGVNAIIKSLQPGAAKTQNKSSSSGGYGKSVYGA